MSTISLVAASAQDLEPVALLRARSWRNTYHGIVRYWWAALAP